jgi:AcrR family transcriptional regulator
VATARPSASTPHGQKRRQRLLDATAELVAERGFHSVGIVDIGAAAGVTGSAIYRHFRNKQQLLVALFDRVADELDDRARVALEVTDQSAALHALVCSHVEFALTNRAVIAVYHQEEINLPDADRRRLRRKQRAYVQVWADVVVGLRPDMSDAEAVAVVNAVLGLLNAVASFESRVPDERLGEIVGDMALRAIDAIGVAVDA